MTPTANQPTEGGLAWKRYSRQTPLRDVAPALNGRASLAGARPCRTGAASFMVARARGHARQRAWSAAGGQIGNTGTFRGKPRPNGRACGQHYLRSAICAARFKAPAARAPNRPHTSSHWHRCQWLSQQYLKSSTAPPLPKLAIACTSWTNRNYLIALAAARSLATDASQFGNPTSSDGGTRRASICILSFLISEMSAQRHRGVKSP
jgi:hypothetical protein